MRYIGVLVTFLSLGHSTQQPQFLEGERFIQLTVSSGFSEKLVGSMGERWKGMAEDSCSLKGSQKAERKENSQEQEKIISGHTPVFHFQQGSTSKYHIQVLSSSRNSLMNIASPSPSKSSSEHMRL